MFWVEDLSESGLNRGEVSKNENLKKIACRVKGILSRRGTCWGKWHRICMKDVSEPGHRGYWRS